MLRPLVFFFALSLLVSQSVLALEPDEVIDVWPDLAPGETSRDPGTALPGRDADNPPITRVESIKRPTMDVFKPTKPTGQAILILPGGGFRYVVPDLEGSEAAQWLNEIGITVFVLRYRTTADASLDPWRRPLQDSQRAMRVIRASAKQWNINPDSIGLFGFSAGGQIAAIHLTQATPSYDPIDSLDEVRFSADFSLLVYPWRIHDEVADALIKPIVISKNTPPAFIVHTHDDQSSSLGAVYYYVGLKKHDVPAEIHVYSNGGHGYGVRSRPGSMIGTWKDRATEWLQIYNGSTKATESH